MRVRDEVSRRYVLALAMLSVTLFLVGSGCSGSKFAGKYASDDNPKHYVELRTDSSFFMQSQSWGGVDGKYRVDGDVITLTITVLGSSQAQQFHVAGNVMTDNDGREWVKGVVTHIKTTMTLVPDSSSISFGYGKSVKLTATLDAGGKPLQGKTISWSATSGSVSQSDTTNSSGQVVATYSPPYDWSSKNLPLSVTISASFAGSVLYAPVTTNARIGVK